VSDIAVRRLEFARQPGDVLTSGRVVLDPGGQPYALSMIWRPVAESWFLSIRLATGGWIGRWLPVRDRTDCLLGVSTQGRPKGAIIAYDPKGRGALDLESFSQNDVRLYYLPGGFNPYDFAVYQSDVV
jgi:hypothetical protein